MRVEAGTPRSPLGVPSFIRAALLRLALASLPAAWAAPTVAAAQEGGRLFPDVPSFEFPAASPRVNGFAGRILRTSRSDNLFGPGTEAEAAVGEDFPLLALRRGPRPISLGFGVEVYGRFSLHDPKSDQISTDWVVGLSVASDLGAWDLAAQVYHESSHLGDEYASRFDADRLDWSREVAAGWASYSTGPWRLTGTFRYVLSDQLNLGPAAGGIGLDYGGRPLRFLGLAPRPVGGVYAEGEQATDWRISATGRLGLAFPGIRRGRELTLAVLAHDGRSTQRQFYQAESRYVGMEIRFDL